jgi:hypothetical protein
LRGSSAQASFILDDSIDNGVNYTGLEALASLPSFRFWHETMANLLMRPVRDFSRDDMNHLFLSLVTRFRAYCNFALRTAGYAEPELIGSMNLSRWPTVLVADVIHDVKRRISDPKSKYYSSPCSFRRLCFKQFSEESMKLELVALWKSEI